MPNHEIKINYIYDSTQAGGAEKQCRLSVEASGDHIINTGTGIRKILRIYNSLVSTKQEVTHIFWLSHDQAIAGLLSKIIKNKHNRIYYNIRNQPLKFWSNMRSFLYEKLAFSIKVDGWISNSKITLAAYEEKYRTIPENLVVVRNVIETGQGNWKFNPSKGCQIIFVGHPNRIKGFDLFIDKIKELNQKSIESIFIYGFAREQLNHNQMKTLEKFKISYFGIHSNWFCAEYENAILINTSRSEGFPSAPLEAIGHGIPILIPDHISYASELDGNYTYKHISEITIDRINTTIRNHTGN